MTGDRDLMTAHDLADALHVSVKTIWEYTRDKKIPYVELGPRNYRYHLADVKRAMGEWAFSEKTGEYEAERKFTYQEYLDLPEEPGYRFEVLDGILIREPSPNVAHQRALWRICRILHDYFREVDSEGEVFIAPLDVTLGDFTVVQPDVFYVAGSQRRIIREARIDGPPTLVVEVISPSSRQKDRLTKLRIYQQASVQHYWILNPEDRTLECFALRDSVYAVVAGGMDEDVVEHPGFPGLPIPLADLWSAS